MKEYTQKAHQSLLITAVILMTLSIRLNVQLHTCSQSFNALLKERTAVIGIIEHAISNI